MQRLKNNFLASRIALARVVISTVLVYQQKLIQFLLKMAQYLRLSIVNEEVITWK